MSEARRYKILFGSNGWPLLQDRIRAYLGTDEVLVLAAPGRPLEDQMEDVDVLVPTMAVVDEGVLARAPRLQAIVQPAAGFQNIDVAACQRAGVPVCVAPGVNAQSTAECTVMLILMLAKQAVRGQEAFKLGTLGEPVGMELRGKILGVVGMGKIGTLVADVCRALGMEVLSTRSSSTREELEHLLRLSDVVSLHCPLLPTTQGLIGATELALMRPGALLVNMARGGVVVKEALEDAVVRRGRLGGVALDVHWAEPGWDAAEPLYRHPKVVALPHVASTTVEVFDEFARWIADNVRRARAGEALVGAL